MSQTPVWLVTGASKGIGLETVLVALGHGFSVAATSRNAEKLTQAVSEEGLSRGIDTTNFLAVGMTFDQPAIEEAVAKVLERFGRIDVLVNNAGYAILGAFEEFSLEEVKANFDVNVFGLMQVTQAVLPAMRAQHSGLILNIASISATTTGPTQSVYSATKAAVMMMSEALDMEVRPFGIRSVAVCPWGVRTDFLDSSSMKHPAKTMPEYTQVQATKQALGQLNHNQSGNPRLVGEALVQISQLPNPPFRIYLGEGALGALVQHTQQVMDLAGEFQDISRSIDG